MNSFFNVSEDELLSLVGGVIETIHIPDEFVDLINELFTVRKPRPNDATIEQVIDAMRGLHKSYVIASRERKKELIGLMVNTYIVRKSRETTDIAVEWRKPFSFIIQASSPGLPRADALKMMYDIFGNEAKPLSPAPLQWKKTDGDFARHIEILLEKKIIDTDTSTILDGGKINFITNTPYIDAICLFSFWETRGFIAKTRSKWKRIAETATTKNERFSIKQLQELGSRYKLFGKLEGDSADIPHEKLLFFSEILQEFH